MCQWFFVVQMYRILVHKYFLCLRANKDDKLQYKMKNMSYSKYGDKDMTKYDQNIKPWTVSSYNKKKICLPLIVYEIKKSTELLEAVLYHFFGLPSLKPLLGLKTHIPLPGTPCPSLVGQRTDNHGSQSKLVGTRDGCVTGITTSQCSQEVFKSRCIG